MENNVPARRYDQCIWVQYTWYCGTYGCLAFHAAECFPELLRIKKGTYFSGEGFAIIKIVSLQEAIQQEAPFLGLSNTESFESVFGEGTARLTDGSAFGENPTPQEAAKKIREFVESNEAS